MRETRADSTQAVVLAIALHAFLFALMFVGLWWNRDAAPIAAAGSPISAEMVDTSELSTQMQRALARDPEPLPEPEPEPAPPQVEEEEAAPLPQPIPEPAPQESPVPKQQERSEEHTSALQSLMRISYAVFCLKKKTIEIPDQQPDTQQ